MSDTHSIAKTIGRAVMCAELDVNAQMVSKAVRSGKFPASWWIVMKQLCERKGIDCPPELFGFKEASEVVAP